MAIAVSSPGAFALKKITSTIPVVFVIVPAPIGSGLAASLAHPGSNLTGLSFWAGGDPPGKSLALLKEAVPNLSSAAVFFDPDPQMGPRIPRYAAAAKSLGLSLRSVEIPAPDAIEPAFAQAQSDHVDLFSERARVGVATLAHRMPTISVSVRSPDDLRTGLSRLFPEGRRLCR